ncbi:MAG: DUF1570 domain-containing protein [Dysgonamonadaceae bacterium]|jgi:uncharacterized protein YjaZ|nr:DUF1570 domain-containing protein [Dysgonamonadaceae bacterium]
MKNSSFYIVLFCLLLSVKLAAQENLKFIDNENLLTKKETACLEKAIQYEADFFNRLFLDKTVDLSAIKFTVATGFMEFINVQAQAGALHANASGFFSSRDSTLVVLKNKKSKSNGFLSTCYHELSHAFLHLHVGDKYIPAWFNEGLAEYLDQMTFDKKKIVHRVNNYGVMRVKTLIELKDLNLSEFVEWNYQTFSQKSFTQEGYGYAAGYCMVLFLMQQNEERAITIFSNLIGARSTKEVFDRRYAGGFAQFEKDFIAYIESK